MGTALISGYILTEATLIWYLGGSRTCRQKPHNCLIWKARHSHGKHLSRSPKWKHRWGEVFDLRAPSGWRCELLRRPRRFLARADTNSRSGCPPVELAKPLTFAMVKTVG
jgi:hypothetical protein